jgi:hypothetical protein
VTYRYGSVLNFVQVSISGRVSNSREALSLDIGNPQCSDKLCDGSRPLYVVLITQHEKRDGGKGRLREELLEFEARGFEFLLLREWYAFREASREYEGALDIHLTSLPQNCHTPLATVVMNSHAHRVYAHDSIDAIAIALPH